MRYSSWPRFLLSGCAVLSKQELKPAAKTLSHGRLVYLADSYCRRADLRLRRHRSGKGCLAAIAYLRRVYLPEFDRLLFQLHGLTPPPWDVVAYRRMLATANDIDLVAHHFFQAADELQIRRAKPLIPRLRRLGNRFQARAKRVGLKTCAKD